MFTRTAFSTSLTALAVATLLSAAPAMAETAAVKFNDLDLRTDAGKATLKHRIERAAQSVCNAAGSRELTVKQQADDCLKQAMAQAERTYNTAVAQAESDHQVAATTDAVSR
jgi:UrcA family protein